MFWTATLLHPQPFPLGPLWRFALHERDGGLRRANLHDPSHQGHLPHSARRLPQDHGRQEGGDQLLHLADDQGLHEESCASEPPPDCSGAEFLLVWSAAALVPIDRPISLFLLCCWQVDDELEIKAYYAGHVLGAAMVHIKVGSESVVYTVSVNKPALCCSGLISLLMLHNNVCVPFRETTIWLLTDIWGEFYVEMYELCMKFEFEFWTQRLCKPFVLYFSAAWIDKCRPDILISESTYATTIRDSKRCRERDFLKKVHETIERGGKVRYTCSWLLQGSFIISDFLPTWDLIHSSASVLFITGGFDTVC